MLSDIEKCQHLLEDFSKRAYSAAEKARKAGSIFMDLAEEIEDRRRARYWDREYQRRTL